MRPGCHQFVNLSTLKCLLFSVIAMVALKMWKRYLLANCLHVTSALQLLLCAYPHSDLEVITNNYMYNSILLLSLVLMRFVFTHIWCSVSHLQAILFSIYIVTRWFFPYAGDKSLNYHTIQCSIAVSALVPWKIPVIMLKGAVY